MVTTPRRWTRLLALLAILFAILNTANALNKGGDAAVFFEGGRRFLHAEPLYAGSSAADGFIGPPFQAMFFAPFAAVAAASTVAARLLWHVLNLACLVLGVWFSMKTWDAVRGQLGFPARSWLPMLFAPLVALLLPLQTNFEHQNMNALLLALLASATWQLTMGSALVGGVLVGTATALKAFPALVILYLLARRCWTAASAAVLTAGVLSVAPVAVYGGHDFIDLARTFWRLSTSGWPIRGNNQSLIAAVDRVTSGAVGGLDAAGVRQAAEAPVATAVFAILAVLLAGALVASMMAKSPTRAAVAVEITAVIVLAILLSPIAWDHYWVLLFPAFLIVYDSREPRLLGRTGTLAFWTAAILTTGLSPLSLGGAGFNVARQLSTYTIGAIVIYVALLMLDRHEVGGPVVR